MITKQCYVEYLICTPINYTCFNLSEHLEHISHDVVSNFLKQSRITAREIWELVKELIKNTEDSFLILDDSVQCKRYSKSIELVKTQYSGAVGSLVRGIGVVNLIHSDVHEHYPVDYRIYNNAADGKTKNDHFKDILLNAIANKGLQTKTVMCQHFSGHTVKQLFAAIRSLRVTNSHWRNGDARGYKTLQYIRTPPV
ncbi:hypothetical protein [Methylobacter sp.]|uniref:hypothetical protein n=1 Tax=Methylobacter sp. TaxID=2051955 RepID=UPI002FDE6036